MVFTRLKFIKSIQRTFLVSPVIVFLFVVTQFNIEVRSSQITLYVESGEVQVFNPFGSHPEFKKVTTRYITLFENSVVRTNEGSAYLLLPGKSLISLDVFSSVGLESITSNSYVISSSYGRTWHKVQSQLNDHPLKYELQTPTANLVSLGTEFELKVDKKDQVVSQVTLLEGQAFVTNSQSQNTQQFEQGKQVKVTEGISDFDSQDVDTEVIDSDFYKKNQKIGAEIDKMSDTASHSTYKNIIAQASNAVMNSLSKESTQQPTINSQPTIVDDATVEKTKPQPVSQKPNHKQVESPLPQSTPATPIDTSLDQQSKPSIDNSQNPTSLPSDQPDNKNKDKPLPLKSNKPESNILEPHSSNPENSLLINQDSVVVPNSGSAQGSNEILLNPINETTKLPRAISEAERSAY